MSDRLKDSGLGPDESAALASLGCLSEQETEEFRLKAEADPGLADELRSMRELVADLALAAAGAEPPVGLRDKVLQRARSKSGPVLFSEDGLLIYRPSESDWEAEGRPGVFRKMLNYDRDLKFVTCLLRIEAGNSYPAHRHTGTEELLLLEGDAMICGVRMRPGDYCRATADSVHQETRTEGGAVFLVRASRNDQIISS